MVDDVQSQGVWACGPHLCACSCPRLSSTLPSISHGINKASGASGSSRNTMLPCHLPTKPLWHAILILLPCSHGQLRCADCAAGSKQCFAIPSTALPAGLHAAGEHQGSAAVPADHDGGAACGRAGAGGHTAGTRLPGRWGRRRGGHIRRIAGVGHFLEFTNLIQPQYIRKVDMHACTELPARLSLSLTVCVGTRGVLQSCPSAAVASRRRVPAVLMRAGVLCETGCDQRWPASASCMLCSAVSS
jgi:hypothetical protein